MRHKHGTLILYLRKALVQRREHVQCSMRAQDDAFGHPCRCTCLHARRLKFLNQPRTRNAQRIRPHGERRTRIIAVAERLCALIAIGAHPTLRHPQRMLLAQRQ